MYREGTTVQYGVQWTTQLRGSPGLTVRRRCTTTWAAALASCHVIASLLPGVRCPVACCCGVYVQTFDRTFNNNQFAIFTYGKYIKYSK